MESVLETIRQSELIELGSERDVFFETPSNDVVDSISKCFEGSVSQHSDQPHSQASDSDSGGSLFLTQSVTPVCRTVKRRGSSQRPVPPFPLESDADSEGDCNDDNRADEEERPGSLSQIESHREPADDDLFGVPQEMPALPADRAAKRRIRSQKWKRAPVQPKFPFLKNSQSEPLSTHKNQILVNSEIGGFFECIKKISEERGLRRRELCPKGLEEDYDSMEWGTDEDVRIVDKESFISIPHKRNRQKWLPASRWKAKQMLEKTTKKKKNEKKVRKEKKKPRNKSQSHEGARLARQITQSSENLLTGGSDDEIVIEETQNPYSDQAPEEAGETSAPEILEHGSTDDGEDRMGLEKILFREQERDDTVEDVHHEQQENEGLVPDSGVCIGSQDLFEESDTTMACSSLKETRVRDSNEKDKESCAVQSDGRNSLQKKRTVVENHSETFLDTEAGSDSDNTNISELQRSPCHVPQIHEKTSPVANENREAKKDQHKKTPADDSMTLTQSEENEPSSLPTQSLADDLSGSRVNADSSSRTDLTTGVQAETAMETGGQWLFNYDGFSMIKRREKKKPLISELFRSSNSDASQNGGLSQHDKISRHQKRKQSTLLVEDNEGQESVCRRASEEPVEAFPINSVSAHALSTDVVQDCETNAAEVAKKKRKRDGKVPLFPYDTEGTCLEEMSEIPRSTSEVLVSAAEPEQQTATVLSSPISNEVSHQDSNTEINMDTCKNIVQLDESEPLNIEKWQIMSETVECNEHTESGLEPNQQESFLENSAGTQTRFEQSRSDNLTEPLNSSEIISNTLNQVSCLNFKVDDFISPRKKKKRKKEEAVRDDVAVEAGQVETSEDFEFVLKERITKKKKKKMHFDEEKVRVETDRLETTEQVEVQDYEQQTTELVPKKKVKKKTSKEQVAEENLAVEITQVETTEQFDAPEMIQHAEHHSTELVPEKKAKKKKRKEQVVEENVILEGSQVESTEQFDALKMIQHSEQQGTELVPEKKAKKKKRKEQVVEENVILEGSQVESTEQFDALEMIQHSEQQVTKLIPEKKAKKKKRKEQVVEENVILEGSQVESTEQFGALEMIQHSEQQGTELVLEKKVKTKKRREQVLEENLTVEVSQVESTEPFDALEMIPHSVKKRKKKREHADKDNTAVETSQVVATEQVEAPEVIEDSQHQGSELVPEKKVKKKKNKGEQAIEENVLKPSQVASTEQVDNLELIQETEQQDTELVPDKKKLKRKKKRALVVEKHVALETSNMETTEHIGALEGVEDSEQQATEMVSRKKKKKEKKKKREQLVEENVFDQDECQEVVQESEQQTPKVTPGKKVKRKRDRSTFQDTEVTQEQVRKTPCATSENMSVFNANGSLMTTDSLSPRMETNVSEEGSSAGLDWEDCHCPPGFGGSSFLKKKKKKRKVKANDSSVSDGMGPKEQDEVVSLPSGTESRNGSGIIQSLAPLEASTVPDLRDAVGDKKIRNSNTSLSSDSKISQSILQSEETVQLKAKKKKRRLKTDIDVKADLFSEDALSVVSQESLWSLQSTHSEARSEKEKKIKRDNIDSENINNIKQVQYVHSSDITTGLKTVERTQHDKDDSIPSSGGELLLNTEKKKKKRGSVSVTV